MTLSLRLCVSAVIFSAGANAQLASPVGSLEVSGRVKIDGKQEKLSRKRFYLLRGGLSENSALIERLRNATITSRDCYYSQKQASPEFICWLRESNCESPYCRKIEAKDVELVPEFRAAFNKGMTQFRRRKVIATDWLTTNLSPDLTSGYYRSRASLTDDLLGGIKPLQSSMTDSVTVKAIFTDIALPVAGSEKFLVTNILPIEFGNKSYLWACEVEIGAAKPASLRLLIPEGGKPVKNCEVWVKDLPVCKTGECNNK